jgi:SAM-dependent methyltransferase
MEIRPHSPDWYDRLATLQEGYYYPWKSQVAPLNGEDAYLGLVRKHLTQEKDVLDVGCGHGDVALSMAPFCRGILAYDRVESYIQIAQKEARKAGVENLAYIWHDSSAEANQDEVHIPAKDDAFDVLISRRGPLHWIADARRVARPGAVIIQLNPLETPIPPWAERLPEPLRSASGIEYQYGMLNSVKYQLEQAGLNLHSAWTYDVPEFFDDPRELYMRLVWGFLTTEIPTWNEIKPIIQEIYAEYAWSQGLVLRHTRLLWMAMIPKVAG